MNAPVKTTLENNILTISLNREEKKNALTQEMYTALVDALESASADPEVRVVCLTGSKDCFTAGNDMMDFFHNPNTSMDSPVMQFILAAVSFEKPLIAAVNGPAVGIGTTILMHCDLVYAGPDALFQLPFVSLGLCPEAGSSLLLPNLAGYQRAAEMLLLGEPFTAEQAREAGIVNRVVDDVQSYAQQRAQALAAQPPAAIRLAKKQMKEPLLNQLKETIASEGQAFAKGLQSPEAKEAIGAFLQKRKPDFSRFK
ncbi:enoyl-CoA hydratase [Endozoicomonadaceae bacterium StTr2]